MNEHKFTAEIARQVRVGTTMPAALPERVYATPAGAVRVLADWTPLASDEDIVRIDVRVIEEGLDARDLPAFVELFFHDAFLLFNIATPGSFGGEITVTGGEFRVNDLSFDPSPFACVTSTMPLAEVAAWYPAATQQIASTPMQTVLFHLLHIGRGGHDEGMIRVRLNECLKALGIDEPLPEIAIVHPMHDETLDERVDDSATAILDRAMNRVLIAIQDAARR
jgi:hypothetical protein